VTDNPARSTGCGGSTVIRARTIALAATVVLVAVTGCGGHVDQPRSPALAPEQYQANLDLAAGRLQQAMRNVKTAQTTRGLKSRLTITADELRAISTNLRRLRAPKNAATAHMGLVDALSALASEASLNDEVCGGASALTELSRSEAAQKLRSASRELAKLGYRTRRLTVRRRRQSNRSLPNGSIVARSGTGTGRLSVTNGGSTDAVLKLATSRRRTILGIYVRAGAVANAGGIPPGSYRVLFASGRDWDRARRGFTRQCHFTRFEGQVNYRPRVTYRLTLTATAGGNATTQSIDEDEFLGR